MTGYLGIEVFWRSFFTMTTINYERYCSLGFCYSMIPALRVLYPNQEDFQEAMQRHNEFFNCHPYTGNAVIGVSLALDGNPAGPFVFLIPNVLLNVCSRWLFIKYGYELGTNLVVKMKGSSIIDKFVEGATIVGMMVVGAMIVGFVNLNIGCVWLIGEKEIILQDIINSLMPSLIPLLLVLSYYWILIKNKKGMYICIIASFVLGIAGKAVGLF